MPLTVVNISYPFAVTGPDAIGGAEQILSALDAALVREGHRSIVIAPEGSQVKGTHVPIPRYTGVVDDTAFVQVHGHVRDAIARTIEQWPVDVLHFHGVDYDSYVPASGPPVVATLHLPIAWYRSTALWPRRTDAAVVCVSDAQRRSLPRDAAHVFVVPNGVSMDEPPPAGHRGDFAVALGRICPEKGYEHALDAARVAACPLLLAGHVFPYPEHQQYFEKQIVPRLDQDRRFIGPASRDEKRRLLASARCVLVPSVVPETSSLTVMEALACGTPAIAFRCGALPELIDDGVTGFLVGSVPEMAAAIARVDTLDRQACIAAARSRFAQTTMVDAYFDLYVALSAVNRAVPA